MKEIPDWNTYFMSLLGPLSSRSKDPNTQVSCVIVGPEHNIRATGYNSLPRGVRDDAEIFPERFERPEKYMWIEHAERNAIYSAARIGTPLAGSRLICQLLPCMDCGRAIIQVGIVEIVYDADRQRIFETTTPRYVPDFERVRSMLTEAGVKVTPWSEPNPK
jgi:dCMP deaminase